MKAITVNTHTHKHDYTEPSSSKIMNEFPISALQVRFSRPESEQARQRRLQSYEFLQKKQAEEPWVHLHYHGVKVGEGSSPAS